MGLEVVVRPVVFPNIRPASPRAAAPLDSSENVTFVNGASGRFIDLPYQWSVSLSRSITQKEKVRVVDKQRVMQVDKYGNIIEDNFVDLELLKKLRMDGPTPVKVIMANPMKADNIKTLETDVIRYAEP